MSMRFCLDLEAIIIRMWHKYFDGVWLRSILEYRTLDNWLNHEWSFRASFHHSQFLCLSRIVLFIGGIQFVDVVFPARHWLTHGRRTYAGSLWSRCCCHCRN